MRLRLWREIVSGWLLAWVWTSPVAACGPSPQKVVEQLEVKMSVPLVQARLAQAPSLAVWHPMVREASQEQVAEAVRAESGMHLHRTLQLSTGWWLQEDLRKPFTASVVEDSVMTAGNFPMSQYRGVLEVRPAADASHSLLVWSARFNNQANLLDAPAGQDNATAIAAVTAFYRQGLKGLKQYLETGTTQHFYQAKETQ